MAVEIGQKIPFSLEAEQSYLGSILLRPASFEDAAGLVSIGDFYLPEHSLIYEAMVNMFDESKNIDPVTLVNTLISSGKFDQTGGIEYIKNLASSVSSAANIKDYAKIVKDNAILRRLIKACDEISSDASSAEGSVEQIVDTAEQKIFDIAQKKISNDFRSISDVLTEVYQDLQALWENPEQINGIKTGYSDLDNVLVMMGKGELIFIGARPGMGKTSFCLNIGTNVAKSTGQTVCIFSLEMNPSELVKRILSSEAMVSSNVLRSGRLSTDDWESIAQAAEELGKCNILIDDSTDITITEMKAKLRRVKNLGLVIIDYLQLMNSGKNTDNRVQQIGDITRNLKLMAKELNVPIICCTQLSRAPDKKAGKDKRPMLSDLRDSGTIEQDADCVIFLYRQNYYNAGGEEDADAPNPNSNKIEVIVQKNRHGGQADVEMYWDAEYTRFRSIDKYSQEDK